MKTSRLFKKQKVLPMIRALRLEINCRMKRTFLVAAVENVMEVLLLEDSLWFSMSGLP